MKIAGARGLESAMEWNDDGKARKGTLLEYFAFCGAELDDQQKKTLAEL